MCNVNLLTDTRVEGCGSSPELGVEKGVSLVQNGQNSMVCSKNRVLRSFLNV